VVYGSGNKQEPMQDRELSCLLHWTTSLNRHTEKLIRVEFQETHKMLCKQYKDAKLMAEVEERYLGIKGWWLSSRAALEDSLRELDDWLGFWHFRYRQWDGFLELVRHTPPQISISLFNWPNFYSLASSFNVQNVCVFYFFVFLHMYRICTNLS
jgi:hypothetical protein